MITLNVRLRKLNAMDKDYVVNGNKLIALYLGYEYIPHNNEYGWKPGWWKSDTPDMWKQPGAQASLMKIDSNRYLGRKHHDLRFYNSWGLMMGVLDVMEMKGYTSSIKTNYVRLNPPKSQYDEYLMKVIWNKDGYVVYSNLSGEPNEFVIKPLLRGKLESITKKQAMFIMLVESIKIVAPKLLTKL